ncbi:hypothetical protein [Defluviimonas salinarum]|uniref:Uncharacterized protein n=1 Tax=Defluviimonas salinarum TaxID=2992147 RepID=A0ABT3IXV8_9RHOB|nr:hypothetical protein [Defluviimonas salinarum]MCW3780268.1 hypothetical protein [Defluviimonas salinarum]
MQPADEMGENPADEAEGQDSGVQDTAAPIRTDFHWSRETHAVELLEPPFREVAR